MYLIKEISWQHGIQHPFCEIRSFCRKGLFGIRRNTLYITYLYENPTQTILCSCERLLNFMTPESPKGDVAVSFGK